MYLYICILYIYIILYYIYIYIHTYIYIYIYIYIYTNLQVNAIVGLPYPRSRDSQGLETFLAPSADIILNRKYGVAG